MARQAKEPHTGFGHLQMGRLSGQVRTGMHQADSGEQLQVDERSSDRGAQGSIALVPIVLGRGERLWDATKASATNLEA
jgi:hypothetical protein